MAGALARDMLALRALDEIEQRLLLALREESGATWAALYRPANEVYRRSRESRSDGGSLPLKLDAPLIAELLEEGNELRPCVDPRLLRRAPGVALVGGISAEFESLPTLLLIGPGPDGESPEADLCTLRDIVAIGCTALCNAELLEWLRSQVFVDFLTGCYNRRAFDEHLAIELVRARRYDRPISLFMLDLDDFKIVNDRFGHGAGDQALKRVGEMIRTSFRTTDRVCRFGGDEFAVIFPETPKDEVLRLAERLRRRLASISIDEAGAMPVHVSIGVAAYPDDGHTAEDLLDAADRALYHAKASGRNQVVAS